jgi:hypothetical protein
MKSRARIILAATAALVLGTAAWAQQPDAAASSPAPVESQVTGSAPSPGYVWMSGHWNQESGQWKWIAAHWELPPSRSAVWIEGHWMASGSSWVWSNGAWNVGAPTQASNTPPQLPPQTPEAAAAAEQGAPSPSTPPPNVNGQFVQGAQVPVADQAPVVTEYPADYTDAYYPGYYWTGSTWLWGGYPGYYGFGLGLGPVVFGWGHGGGFRGGGGFHGGGFGGRISGGGHFR